LITGTGPDRVWNSGDVCALQLSRLLGDSNHPMSVDYEKATNSVRKLRKLLNDFPARPSPEEVHKLRTRSRKLEAIVHALSPAHDPDAKRLLKQIKPLRKAAGKVRDMDVLTANLFSLSAQPAGEALVRFTEHLAELRRKHADQLHRVVKRNRKQARRCLKGYTTFLEQAEAEATVISPAAAQILAAQLEHWPKLHAENLHEFRIHAKELHYMLQLNPLTDEERIQALGETKDAAGAWHDWLELGNMAEEILDPEADRAILDQIHAIIRNKLRAGLTAANRLRKLSIEIPKAA
jgi:CHAD domain-containing protein